MDLQNAKLGERYLVYLSEDGQVATTDVGFGSVIATIISLGSKSVLLGWKENEKRPPVVIGHSNTISNYVISSADISNYPYSRSVWRTISAIKHMETCFCSNCNLCNPYATPNQANGTYLCFECRV